MRIVVGLGNPGPEYACSRHNVGFMLVECLLQRWRIALDPVQRGLRHGQGVVNGVPTMLVQPRQYMNRSGEALMGLKLPFTAEDLIVAHDDIDLPFGQLRVRRDGGSGGHRGIESLLGQCGDDFDRVRIGVGRPPDGVAAADYVLMEFGTFEREQLEGMIERAGDAVECLLAEGIQEAMNRFNARSVGERIA